MDAVHSGDTMIFFKQHQPPHSVADVLTSAPVTYAQAELTPRATAREVTVAPGDRVHTTAHLRLSGGADELYQKINVRQCVPAQAEGLLHVPDHQTCYMAIAVHTGPLADGAGIAVHSGLYDPAAFPFPDGRNIGIGPRVLFRGEDRASGKQGLHHLLLLRCGVCGRGGSQGIPSHHQDQAGKQQGTGTDKQLFCLHRRPPFRCGAPNRRVGVKRSSSQDAAFISKIA